MRGLVEVAVRRRVSVFMTALAVIAFGVVGYQRLTVELFPDISYPSITIQTDFPDTAPQEVETLVSRPVEEVVGVLQGLRTVRSVSRPGVSEVTLDFDWGSDMDQLSMEVREKLDRLILPEGTEDPIVLRFDPALDPIVRLALHGEGSLTALRRLADRQLKQDFETLEGVASAQVRGGYEPEVQIEVDQERLAALGIPLETLRQVVGVSNVNIPGGALRGAQSQYLVRTINEFESVEEIGNLIVRQVDGAAVRLRDVATVRMATADRDEITRVNGHESVEIAIFKEGDANTVRVARGLRERIAEWQQGKLPPQSQLTVLFDQSGFIEAAVSGVRNAALIGGLLAVLILLAFLRDLRSSMIIATSITLSIVITFVIMYRADVSLNIMSLGGLTLGIGMLVDNSIVVLEAISRAREQGLGRARAAIEGTLEVGAAVVASTLTTVAVFLPIVFVEGMAGQLFRDQALTVTFSLSASLLVAVTVIPMLSALGPDRPPSHRTQTLHPTRTARVYDRLLGFALRRPAFTLALAVLCFTVSVVAARGLHTGLIPSLTEGEFYFEVKLPEGSSLLATDRIVEDMEESVAQDDRIERYFSTVGSRLAGGGLSLQTRAENLAQLNVVLSEGASESDEAAVIEDLRSAFVDIPDLSIEVGRPSYFQLKTPVEVLLFADDLTTLRDLSLEMVERLQRIDGVIDLRSSLEAGNPELQVIFDRQRLAALGLDMGTLSESLRNRVQGVVPTRYKLDDQQIDVRIRNAGIREGSRADVRNLVLPGPEGPIRLMSVADVHLDRGPAEIHRVQQQRAAVISGDLRGRSLGDVLPEIQSLLDSTPLPPNVTVALGGQNEEMQSSFASLRFALALAVFLVYLVMASTFESFLHPLLVLFTIPLATVGVVLGLRLTDTTVSVIVLIGVVMLVGIVVNNAIVLIDAINRFRREGDEKLVAIRRAGHVRLRPILMTTLTTVLGLAPMAIPAGDGAQLRSPLAITVASGLLLSTLLTLVVIPAAYALVPSKVSPLPSPEEVPSA